MPASFIRWHWQIELPKNSIHRLPVYQSNKRQVELPWKESWFPCTCSCGGRQVELPKTGIIIFLTSWTAQRENYRFPLNMFSWHDELPRKGIMVIIRVHLTYWYNQKRHHCFPVHVLISQVELPREGSRFFDPTTHRDGECMDSAQGSRCPHVLIPNSIYCAGHSRGHFFFFFSFFHANPTLITFVIVCSWNSARTIIVAISHGFLLCLFFTADGNLWGGPIKVCESESAVCVLAVLCWRFTAGC